MNSLHSRRSSQMTAMPTFFGKNSIEDKNDLQEIFQSNLKTVKWLTFTHTHITHLTNVISHLDSLVQAHDLMLLYSVLCMNSQVSSTTYPCHIVNYI